MSVDASSLFPIAGVAVTTAAPRPTTSEDKRIAMAERDPVKFAVLLAQLGVLIGAFQYFDIEEPAFEILVGLVTAGFAVHYWLPFAWKKKFYVCWSVLGAFAMLQPWTAALLVLAGLALYAIVSAPFSFRQRLAMVCVAIGGLSYARAIQGFGIPYDFWPVFGSIFMFRFIVYLYDAAYAKTRPRIWDFLSYFFILPNYYFLLFPVIDFQTHQQSYYRRNIHEVAQRGISWMGRGAIHLLLYRLVYHWKGPSNAPDQVTTLGSLIVTMVLTYMLYLRVSGQFHLIIGFIHLFGYDLPETHRKYLLARSLTDFWRRINIYWKDFMVKIVYFPIYFRMRRSGEVRAQVVATVVVFVVTWFLHAYQWFWLRGELLFTWPDTLFWAILGGLVTINLLLERTRPPRVKTTGWRSRLEPLKVAGTFSLIVTLWSLWNAPSVPEWLDLVTWWKLG